MKITCPSCQTSYQIADDKIPAGGARANCPNCGQMLLVPAVKSDAASSGPLVSSSSADFGQTIAYDFSEVDQSRTEVTALLENLSGRDPFLEDGFDFVLRDASTGEEFPLNKESITLGRTDADIKLSDPEVSRKHCTVEVFGDRLVVTDLKSTNGTFYREKKIMTANIGSGESFTVGNTTLQAVLKKKSFHFAGKLFPCGNNNNAIRSKVNRQMDRRCFSLHMVCCIGVQPDRCSDKRCGHLHLQAKDPPRRQEPFENSPFFGFDLTNGGKPF